MKLHNVIQGTPEWLQLRATFHTASEAPAMMGASKHQSRSELLKQKATGITRDVSRFTQELFARGHETECSARALVEVMFDEDFFPVTCSDDAGYLLASLDGRTFSGERLFEHKLWSESLASQVNANDLQPHYYWQLEQELLVTGAEEVIFVCSDGTLDNFVSMVYRPVAGRAEALIAGWHQFDADLADYVPTEAAVVVMATPVDSLPAVTVQMRGELSIISNLPEFGVALRAFIDRIPAKASTDQEFADTEAACKALKKAEDALESAETHALSQMADVESMRRVIADLRNLARTTRLAQEKSVTARKEQIRLDILAEVKAKFSEHIASLNQRLGRAYMPVIATDFPGVIKGKRTISSLHDAVDTELARAKIEANAIADRIQINLGTLHDLAAAHAFLFADAASIVHKANDDLTALVKLRIAEHQQAEEKRLDAQREQIRKEEQAKAEAAVRHAEEDRQRAAHQAALQAEQLQAHEVRRVAEIQRQAEAAKLVTVDQPLPTPVTNVVPLQNPPVAVQTTSTAKMTLGQISASFGFSLTGDFLQNMGFEPVGRERSAVLYREADFELIRMHLIAHIRRAEIKRAA